MGERAKHPPSFAPIIIAPLASVQSILAYLGRVPLSIPLRPPPSRSPVCGEGDFFSPPAIGSYDVPIKFSGVAVGDRFKMRTLLGTRDTFLSLLSLPTPYSLFPVRNRARRCPARCDVNKKWCPVSSVPLHRDDISIRCLALNLPLTYRSRLCGFIV